MVRRGGGRVHQRIHQRQNALLVPIALELVDTTTHAELWLRRV